MPLAKSIIAIATVGTENQSVDRTLFETMVGSVGEQQNVSNFTRRMLTTVAGLKLREKAGWKPLCAALPLSQPCEPEDRPMCSVSAMLFLQNLLKNQYPDETLINEWFYEVEKRGQCVPSELLPMIFHHEQERRISKHLPFVLGKRSEWFCNQASDGDWIWHKPYDPENYWERGMDRDRINVIEVVRESDPQRARRMVMETWHREDDATRHSLLKAFQFGLHADDEPFLESVLSDPTRYVRLAARNLLVRLPQSAYRQQIERCAERMLHLATTGGHRVIQLHVFRRSNRWKPDWNNDPQLWDDIRRKFDLTVHRWAVYMSYVPITFWLNIWNLDYVTFFEAINQNHSLSPVVWQALLDSIERFDDEIGADILFSYADRCLKPDQMRRLVRRMSKSCNEAIAINYLLTCREGIHLSHPAVQPLLAITPLWSESLTEAVLHSVRRRLQRTEKGFEQRTEAILQHFADCIPISAAESYVNLFRLADQDVDHFARIRQNIEQIIALRTKLHAAIDSSV